MPGAQRSAYRDAINGGEPVLPQKASDDRDLIALALETMRAADGMSDAAIRHRLLEIVEDVLRLAHMAEAPSWF